MRVMSEEKLQKLARYIDQYARDNNGESPSLSDIMDYMGMVKSTAYRHVVELEKRGIISYNGKKTLSSSVQRKMHVMFSIAWSTCSFVTFLAKYKWGIFADFTITLFVKNNVGMSEEQIRTLLFHELLHIGIEPGPDGDEIYSVRNHDLEDFKVIIDRFGTDWATKQNNVKE